MLGPSTYRNECGRRAQQALDRIHERTENLTCSVSELFLLFSHVRFIMGAAAVLSTPSLILLINSRFEGRTCTSI